MQPRPMVGRLSTFGRAVDSASPIATFGRQTNLDCLLPPGSLSHRVSSSLAEGKENAGHCSTLLYPSVHYRKVYICIARNESIGVPIRTRFRDSSQAARVNWMRTHEGFAWFSCSQSGDERNNLAVYSERYAF
jgi:hypothetical protein